MKYKFISLYLINIILLFIIAINLIFFGNPTFGTTDDNNLSGFLSGSYTGKIEDRSIFIQPALAKLQYFVQIYTPSVETYSWLLLITVILSLSFLMTILIYKEKFNSAKNIILYLTILPLFIWFVISPTYTTAALVSALCSLLSLIVIISNFSRNKVMYVFSILLITLSFLIRPESFIGILILLTPIYLYFLYGYRFYLKKLTYYFILTLSWFFLIFFINSNLKNIENKDWSQYDKWNQMRHEMQHRKTEKYLIELAQNSMWSIPEYHLFMDLAFGDPKIFNLKWIEKGYDYTASKRSITNLKNYKLIEIFNGAGIIFKQYYGLILFQIVSFIIILSLTKLNFSQQAFFVFLSWSSLLLCLTYIIVFLHITERVMLVLLSTPILILITLLKLIKHEFNKNIFSIKLILVLLPFILYLMQPWGIMNQIKENIKKKQFDQNAKLELLTFSKNAIYIGPGTTELFDSNNPYFQNSFENFPRYITTGNWDTFSPHWENRKKLLGIKDQSIYDSLLRNDVYWISFGTPDTAYLVELFLEEKKGVDVWRQEIMTTNTGLKIFKYGI